MKNIIAIVGPTGVGKTKLSIELAKKIDAEIINGDAMQVYIGMDIGTAKITEEEKEGIIHHLFDIRNINENYTVFDYQRDCRKLIDEILNRNKKVIIVGGTGLYIKAALYDYKFKEGTTSNTYDELSNEELLEKIKYYDINCDIHVNNRKRLVRYLNKLENNEDITNNKDKLLYDAEFIGLTTDRDNLYKIIDNRVDKMLDSGLLKEVESFKNDYSKSKALKTAIGYKEFVDYFNNDKKLEKIINEIKKNSRHYAKRQYTFFNNQFKINWFNTNYNNFNDTVLEVYKHIKEM